MNQELDKLFPPKSPTINIRGTDYPVGQITVSIMGSVNFLTEKAYATIDLENVEDEIDVAAISAGIIAALIDGGEVQRRMETVITPLTGISGELFRDLKTEELVDLIVTIARVNKDFFSMRLAPKMRSARKNKK